MVERPINNASGSYFRRFWAETAIALIPIVIFGCHDGMNGREAVRIANDTPPKATSREMTTVDADKPARSDGLSVLSSRSAAVRPTRVAALDLPVEVTRHIKTEPQFHPLKSAGGRSLAYWVFGESGPVTLVLGGMHGAERTPTLLCAEFVGWLEAHPEALTSGQIVVAPLVDPDGFASRRRNNDNGVDLNRNYPATNWRRRADRHGPRPLSEPETRFVIEVMEVYAPAAIISVHAPLACVNYDGPAEELARRMSQACGLPVRASVGYPTPGSFGSYAGVDKAIPTITLELRPGKAVDPDFDACRRALMAAHEYSVSAREK